MFLCIPVSELFGRKGGWKRSWHARNFLTECCRSSEPIPQDLTPPRAITCFAFFPPPPPTNAHNDGVKMQPYPRVHIRMGDLSKSV